MCAVEAETARCACRLVLLSLSCAAPCQWLPWWLQPRAYGSLHTQAQLPSRCYSAAMAGAWPQGTDRMHSQGKPPKQWCACVMLLGLLWSTATSFSQALDTSSDARKPAVGGAGEQSSSLTGTSTMPLAGAATASLQAMSIPAANGTLLSKNGTKAIKNTNKTKGSKKHHKKTSNSSTINGANSPGLPTLSLPNSPTLKPLPAGNSVGGTAGSTAGGSAGSAVGSDRAAGSPAISVPGSNSAASQPPVAVGGRRRQLSQPWIGAATSSASLTAAARRRRRHLIEEGWVATVEQYPFVAMIVKPDGKYLCTGSLVHQRVVLTAAHCVVPELDGTPNPIVILGKDYNGQRNGLQRIATKSFTHPKFKPGSFDYDVAALVLETTTMTQPARLVPEGCPLGVAGPNKPTPAAPAPYHTWHQTDNSLPVTVSGGGSLADMQLTVLGWGATQEGGLPPMLQQGRVTPLALDMCAHLFQPYASAVSKRMVCVTGRTCAGDSGGPLLAPRAEDGMLQLVGQVSYGFPRQKGSGCPNPNPVTMFTDLSAPRLREWLTQAIIGREVNRAWKEGGEGLGVVLRSAQAAASSGDDDDYSSGASLYDDDILLG